MPRLLYGNLDAESELARETLPLEARRILSGLATLLRAFARDGDEIRTILPVKPERLVEVPGLPRPRLSAGRLKDVTATDVLAWAETAEVAACRPRAAPQAAPAGAPLHELLWQLPRADPEIVAAVNHRAFGLGVARELGCALPGARMVTSEDELVGGAWVVKAPWSAAGRSRYIHRGAAELDSKARRTLQRLFGRHGSLLFEPWMDRTDDFGCAAVLTADEARIVGFHRLLVSRQGRFTGIELPGAALSEKEEQRFGDVFEGVSRALRHAGYRGPFGIDFWRFRRDDGRVALHPLGEINARMTFGLVVRALVDRIREPMGLEPRDDVRLSFGQRLPEQQDAVIPLLHGGRHGLAVWLGSAAFHRGRRVSGQ